jgi:hypothetical protein
MTTPAADPIAKAADQNIDPASTVASLIPLAELTDIEIFEAGTYRGKTYTDADLDTMVANFTACKDEIKPVAVIGHDEDQELLKKSGLPSAGWMESVKKVGTKLLATFKDVPKVIADLISKGAYKRISSEIYNDYNGKGYALRRVAILGGDIPEVKTLADIAALYSDSPAGTTWVTLSEAAPKSVEGGAAAAPATGEENTNMNMDVQELAEKVTELTELVNKTTALHEADKARIAALEGENKKHLDKFTEAESKRKAEDIKRFCMDRMKEGRLSPALWSMGLEKFMADLDDQSIVRFGEGKKTSDLTPLEFMKKLFMAIPKNTLVRLGEVGATGPDPNENNSGLTAAERLTEATKGILKANPTMKYSEAFSKAQQDNPDLAKEYAADMVIN